jgi:Predicted membrane protein
MDKRQTSIDALRGFALMGLLILHCFDHFGIGYYPKLDSPILQWIDTAFRNTVYFLFQGKSYAIFSLLFGLSFFMMMDSQAKKGVDFRLRFLWRLVILFIFGFINGMMYYCEWFVIYAMFGVIIIPLYKVPSKILVVLSVLLFLEIPQVIEFISLLNGKTNNAPSGIMRTMNQLYRESSALFTNGSILDIIKFNAIRGHSVEVLYVLNARVFQMIGLFIAGMLIGRSEVYKYPDKMVYWSKKILPYAIGWFLLCYSTAWLLPDFNLERRVLRVGVSLFKTYGNLGMMMMYICGLTILYYKTVGGRKFLDKLAPVGRMSVTNYMMQSVMGAFIFYGFGLGLAHQSFLICFIIGLTVCLFQISYSNWWIKRFYYGPMEWLWRTLTWFKKVPIKRNKHV